MNETPKSITKDCGACGHHFALHDMGIGDCSACHCGGFMVVDSSASGAPAEARRRMTPTPIPGTMAETPLYVNPWRGIRVRLTRNPWSDWSLGIGRSVWPRPLPHGMTLYVVHLVRWNILLERGRNG